MPQRMPLFMLALVLSTALSGFAQSADEAQPPIRPVQGVDVFRQYCAPCHGLDAQGGGPAATALKQPVPDLTGLTRHHGGSFPAMHVRSTITFGEDRLIPAHGSKQMPMWGPIFHEIEFDRDFGSVRLENVTRYLESLQKK